MSSARERLEAVQWAITKSRGLVQPTEEIRREAWLFIDMMDAYFEHTPAKAGKFAVKWEHPTR